MKLRWDGQALKLEWMTAAYVSERDDGFRYVIDVRTRSKPYESVLDCMQDAEAEVRRLLREAGVEIAP